MVRSDPPPLDRAKTRSPTLLPTELSTVFPQRVCRARRTWDDVAFRLTLKFFRLVPERVHLGERRLAVRDAAAGQLALDVAEPRDEARHRAPQRLLGSDPELAADVRRGEEHVAELVLDRVGDDRLLPRLARDVDEEGRVGRLGQSTRNG